MVFWSWAPEVQRLVEDQIQLTKNIVAELAQETQSTQITKSRIRQPKQAIESETKTSAAEELDTLLNQLYNLSDTLLYDLNHRIEILDRDKCV